ncbi:2-keto-4-pentenoate hydratase [Ramlibacter sp. MMS24-I3-19]|uniref:2-keto-4-pentenoate hydratase n=1 Tax=Ramlibacter sp. MMS24-I3-19 TaxID=3416606 RepID=UPI003CFECC2F
MLDAATLDAIADEVRALRDEVRQAPPITVRHSGFGLDDGYAVAARLHAHRVRSGAVPRGRKIGFTNSGIWPEYGVHHPIWGHVYEHTLHDGSRGPVTLPLAGYCEPKIEPEIAFGLRASPVDATTEALLASIEWVAPAFEIVQSHFPGWKFQAADTIADGGLHGALVLGQRVPIASLGTDPAGVLSTLRLELARDGELVEVGRGSNVLGGPVAALAHLVDVLRAQGPQVALRAGEVVTTGTITAAYAVAPGQRWRSTARGAGLQPLEIAFAR